MVKVSKSKQGSITDITEYFYKLKEIPRSGWKQKLEIKNTESVASHTLLIIVLVFIFSEKYGFSCKKKVKLIEMALIHDLAESITGDITPETMNNKRKNKLENEAFGKIMCMLCTKSLKKRYLELWHDYQTKKSFESKCVHLLDKLEMVLQANYYLRNRKELTKENVGPFFQSGRSYSSHRPNSRLPRTSKRNIQDTKNLQDIKEILEYFSN